MSAVPGSTVLLAVADREDTGRLHQALGVAFPSLRLIELVDPGGLERALASDEVDLLIIGSELGSQDGLSVLRRVKEKWPDLSVIMCAGEGSVELAVEAMKCGLDDYVALSSESTPRLVTAVREALARVPDNRRARESSRWNDEFYHLLFESNPNPRWIYDLETLKFLAVNEAAVQRYGYTREEFARLTIEDIRPPEEIPALQESVAKARKVGGLDFAGLWRHRKKDGTLLFVEIVSHTLTFKGRPAELVVITDVTARKRAEDALRESEERYRLLFERNLAGVYRSTPDGQIIECNQAFARMYGYESPLEIKERKASELYQNEGEREQFLADLKNQKTLLNYEGQGRRKDGRVIHVLENVSLIEPESGGPPYIEGTIVDVSERRELEEQLRQSQKIEAVGRLAGGVAHDFNNLLTAILGYNSLIANQLGEAHPLGQQVQEVRKVAERAADLTRQLLAFSRKQILVPKIISLNSVVSNIDKMLRRIIGEDIELTLSLAPDLGHVIADSGQIEQIILNLAVNSRDAMPQGGELTIETQNVDLDEAYARDHVAVEPGPYVMLAMSDTGIGMDGATQSRIFEPFFTTKELGKGTGLGLATVYGIVKQSGGNIWVYSEPGKGATFKVYLPRVNEGKEVERAGESSSVAGSVRGTETVLLVEDDAAVRGLLHEILQESGYTVLVAPNARDAIDLIAHYEGDVHLLVTDVVMPGVSGPELAARVAARRRGIKILFISGYTDDFIVRHRILDSGAAFLQKPFTPDGLATKVRAILDGKPT